MCLYPKLIKNRKYTANKKNGGVIPSLPFRIFNGKKIKDERVLYVPVGCGKCMECLKKKSREWQVRLQEEIKNDRKGIFVTLTFSNESIQELSEGIKLEGYELDNEIARLGVRRFLERWRKKYKKSVKHWLVTELGHQGTENIHLHGIIFTDKGNSIEDIWQYGYTWQSDKNNGFVNEQTINYIIKYTNKIDKQHQYYKSLILTSAGIGKDYVKSSNSKNNKYNGNNTKEFYKSRKGNKLSLPIYYRNKIYTDEEKEKLWIQKLEEKVRYVNGVKIDISDGEENYYKALMIARQQNRRLGYGNDEKNWDRIKYERERRNMLYKERLKTTEEKIKENCSTIPIGKIEDAF